MVSFGQSERRGFHLNFTGVHFFGRNSSAVDQIDTRLPLIRFECDNRSLTHLIELFSGFLTRLPNYCRKFRFLLRENFLMNCYLFFTFLIEVKTIQLVTEVINQDFTFDQFTFFCDIFPFEIDKIFLWETRSAGFGFKRVSRFFFVDGVVINSSRVISISARNRYAGEVGATKWQAKPVIDVIDADDEAPDDTPDPRGQPWRDSPSLGPNVPNSVNKKQPVIPWEELVPDWMTVFLLIETQLLLNIRLLLSPGIWTGRITLFQSEIEYRSKRSRLIIIGKLLELSQFSLVPTSIISIRGSFASSSLLKISFQPSWIGWIAIETNSSEIIKIIQLRYDR